MQIINNEINSALAHFNVTINDLRNIINIAMERGATYADIYFEHSESNNVQLTDNKVDNSASNIEYGAGVRVVVGEQTGYAYTEIVDVKELTKAAKSANRIACNGEKYNTVDIKHLEIKHNRYPIINDWQSHTLIDRKPFLEKLNDRIFQLDKRVKKVIITQADDTSQILFFNSEGEIFCDRIPMAILSAMCVMQDGERIERGNASRSFHQGFDFLEGDMIEEIAQEVVSRTSILFEAIKPKGGEMAVVMGAGSSGILLHEAIGHAFEADFNRKGASIFSDKLGEMICNPMINVVDDGTIIGNRGSINYDDEGVIGQKTYIVEQGRLNSYLHDRISARYYGVEPTGNGRRESFRYAPVPRMRATYMENGNNTQEEMISTVKHGVFVDVFSNGQVQIGAGDFTFYVKSGY
ncbi:MAG: TldD/PmbA family protein, partial [bacterium]